MSNETLNESTTEITVDTTETTEAIEIAVDDVQVSLEVTASGTKAGIETNRDGVIASPTKKKGKPGPSVVVVNGAIGSPGAQRKDAPKVVAEPKKKETVAIYSAKNVYWEGVGEVKRGYNFVTPTQAEKWLTRTHVRKATPQEVKEAFDN
jgi:hypothetical protein